MRSYIAGLPRQGRQARLGPCLDFGFQYALRRNNWSKNFEVTRILDLAWLKSALAALYRQVFFSPLQSQPNVQTYKPLRHPSSRDSYQRIRFSCCVASLFRIYLEPSDADLMMRGNANDFLISAQHLIAFKKRKAMTLKKGYTS